MSTQHFLTHLDEVIAYNGDGSYTAKRLVQYPIGASGQLHGTVLMIPPGKKVLSHWHDDREAMFYCVAGSGRFVLDEVEREVTPGTAMLQPWMAVHGFAATGPDEFWFLDMAMFTPAGATMDPAGCFVHVDQVPGERTAWGERRAFFPPSAFGNPAIRWIGEYRIEPGGTLSDADRPEGCETLMLCLDGTGEIELLGRTLPVSRLSVHYLIAGLPFAIRNTGAEPLRYVTGSSLPGRYPEPPLFDRLRRAAADPTHVPMEAAA